MGDFLLKLVDKLMKPGAKAAGIITLLFALVLSLAPVMPDLVRAYTNRTGVSCADTVTITESVAWYSTPQSLAGIRSFLLRYYHPNEHNMTRQEVEQLLSVQLQAQVEQVSLTLNGLNLCFPSVGDWYRVNFEYEQYSEDVLDIIFLEQDYGSPQQRELLINRYVDLIEATMRSYQNRVSVALRNKIKEVNK